MKTKRSQEGYLLIDHRNSPGVRTDKVVTAGKGQVLETPTYTCGHCTRIVVLNPLRTRERGWCSRCDHYICDACAATKECLPIGKLADINFERAVRGITNFVNPLLSKGT